MWKVRFSIKNTGNKTLIGKGDSKDILEDTLKLFIGEGFRVINIEQQGQNSSINVERIDNQNFHLDFKQ
ncbi:MAG: hypothetical protein ACI94Y_004251 [Maribacter sp.]